MGAAGHTNPPAPSTAPVTDNSATDAIAVDVATHEASAIAVVAGEAEELLEQYLGVFHFRSRRVERAYRRYHADVWRTLAPLAGGGGADAGRDGDGRALDADALATRRWLWDETRPL